MKIIYVDVDSLRPDHTGPYGYQRATTPNLDRLAERSVRFDNYYCSDSPCLPSRTALVSGQFGITNGIVGHAGDSARFRLESGHAPEPGRPTLAQALVRQGYRTAVLSSFAERHRAYHFNAGFLDTMQTTPDVGDEPADKVTDVAVDWIRRHRDVDDWYLHVTYWDPHTDYLQPAEWTERAAASGPAPEWPDQAAIDEHTRVYGPRSALDLHYAGAPRTNRVPHNMPDEVRTRADFEHLINGYDGAIMYWDHHFGRLLDALEEMGISDEVAVVVSADHGESFGELGSYAEHGLASEPVNHIPLVFFWPGVTDDGRQRSYDHLLYNIDYAPTILELVGAGEKPEKWQGTSFAPLLRDQEQEGRDHLVLGHGAHTFQRSVRTRTHMYTRTYHPGSFLAEWESLWDMEADPHQTENLLEKDPETVDRMRSMLLQWWHELAATPGALPDPMQISLQTGPTLYSDPVEFEAYLRRTGRTEAADDLAERLRPRNGAVPVSWHAQRPITLHWGRREAQRTGAED
ncbi:sulfatase family protein [Kineococcus arenarius]|uniref:sulfatase family protein n=1 Tax=unclassified Kineococcus TaxID=2621656 RepID=UPI003D7DEDED